VSLIVAPYVSWIVRSQPGALRRVIMNLIGNSLKYTESGYVAISLLQSNSTSDAIDLTLIVEDSGRGMSAEFQRTKLFQPFSQEDSFSSGTGLGLSIVKQIIESLNGEIHVESTVGAGTQTTITIRLPVGQAENVKQDEALLRAPQELKGMSVAIITEPDTRGVERGEKTKASMFKACQNFQMTISEAVNLDEDVSIPDVDFLLTDSPSLDQLLRKPSSSSMHKNPLSTVCICTDLAEKMALESRLGRQMNALGWIAELVTQP
jgi:hypothetical protein